MNSATTTEAIDKQAVRTIVEGRYSDAGTAIGNANTATLQLAAQRCQEARGEMRGRGEPYRQLHDREILCRARIKRIAEKAAESF